MKTSKSISELDVNIKNYMFLSDRKVLCCLILNEMDQMLSKVFRNKKIPLWALILVFLFLTNLFPIMLDVGTKQFSWSRILTIFSLSFISTSVVAVIKYLRNVLFPFYTDMIVEKVIYVKDKEELLHSFLERYTNLKNQVVWSCVATLLTGSLLIWAWINYRFPLSPGVFLALCITFFLGTQLPFWTYGIIHTFEILSRCQLRLYALNPSQDETLIRFYELAMMTLSLGSIIVLFFTIATYFAFFRDTSTYLANVVFLIWYILGLLFAMALFLSSTIYTSRIIVKAKRRFLADLQAKIEQIYFHMKRIDPEKLALIDKAWNLHQTVEKTPNSMISWGAMRILASSISIQSLPVLSGLVNWQTITKWFR